MGFAALVISATAMAAAGQPVVGLPASYRREVLLSCEAETIEAAKLCLRNSMSAEDFAILSDRFPARRFRGLIDCEMETAWRLSEPTSPMSREMERLLGVHNPGLAVGMIITDLQMRAQTGHGFNFDNVRGRLGDWEPSTTCNADTTPSETGTKHAD